MKHILVITLLLTAILASQNVHAQSLAIANTEGKQFAAYSPLAFENHNGGQQKIPGVLKIGTIMAGVGIVTGIIGGVIANNNPDLSNKGLTGAAIFVAGGILGITGGSMAMAGITGMHARRRRYGYSIVTPKNNQVGIACNF